MSYWAWLNYRQQLEKPPQTPVESPWGSFRIERRLGVSECGNTYLAYHEEWQRALILRIGRRAQNGQFFCAPLINARHSHPGITQFLLCGVHDGHPYAAREFVRGCSLDRVLQSHSLNLPQVVDLAIQILEVLEVAHAHNLYHGHLVLGNVLLCGIGNGNISLTDWRKPASDQEMAGQRDLRQLRCLLETVNREPSLLAFPSNAAAAFRRSVELLTDSQDSLTIIRHVSEQLTALLRALKTRQHVPLSTLITEVHRTSAMAHT